MPSWKKVITSGSSAHLNELTSSTFLVDGNKSGQFIAVIDNDENNSGHVLKLATDGTGNGTHVLDMENGSNTMFFQIWEEDVIVKLQKIVMKQLGVLTGTEVLVGDDCNLH